MNVIYLKCSSLFSGDVDSGTFIAQRHPSLEDLPAAPGIPELLNQTAGTVTLGWDVGNILDQNYEIYEYSIEGIYTEDPSGIN